MAGGGGGAFSLIHHPTLFACFSDATWFSSANRLQALQYHHHSPFFIFSMHQGAGLPLNSSGQAPGSPGALGPLQSVHFFGGISVLWTQDRTQDAEIGAQNLDTGQAWAQNGYGCWSEMARIPSSNIMSTPETAMQGRAGEGRREVGGAKP